VNPPQAQAKRANKHLAGGSDCMLSLWLTHLECDVLYTARHHSFHTREQSGSLYVCELL